MMIEEPICSHCNQDVKKIWTFYTGDIWIHVNSEDTMCPITYAEPRMSI